MPYNTGYWQNKNNCKNVLLSFTSFPDRQSVERANVSKSKVIALTRKHKIINYNYSASSSSSTISIKLVDLLEL